MKFVAEYRDADLANQYVAVIASITTRPWAMMEICGGQTHTIIKYGIDRLLPAGIRLIHCRGCPVCVPPRQWRYVKRSSNLVCPIQLILASSFPIIKSYDNFLTLKKGKSTI
jgi:hydrogenase expression/formation protein HypD